MLQRKQSERLQLTQVHEETACNTEEETSSFIAPGIVQESS